MQSPFPLRLDGVGKGVQQIVDTYSWVRVRLETEPGGLALRNALTDVRLAPSPPIMVFDHIGGNKRRRAVFPDYKMNRPQKRDDIFQSIALFKELLSFVPCVMVCVDGWEADDVIATLVRQTSGPVRVVTKDRDLAQLCCERDNVSSTAHFDPEEVPDAYVRLYKTLVGDSSDNIPGLRLFGKAAWKAADWRRLRAAFEDGQCPRDKGPEWFGMSTSLYTRMVEEWDRLCTFYEIIGLYDVPMPEISKSMRVGTNQWLVADQILQRYLQ